MMQTLKRVTRFGLQNYFRNGWLSMAATFVMALTLFTVSIFILNAYVTRATTQSIQDKLDMAIYINDGPSEDDVAHFVDQLKAFPEVKEVTYLNKAQVIDEWNKLNFDQKIKSQVTTDNNPLPRTIKLKTYDPSQLDSVATKINAIPFATQNTHMSYKDNRPLIQQLTDRSKRLVRNGIIVSIIFIIIAVVFVYNTIRLIIRFRDDEIQIMKLVGATDSFVRGPFLIEGMLYGFVAGFIALVGLYFYLQNGLSETSSVVGGPDSLIATSLFQFFQFHMLEIMATLVVTAILIAIVCSAISIQHHLKR